ncbi:hypothetical protein [Natrarchaeobius chitinivorans]|uniref:hypothetical protein n=1 Tax=Natrarchaeobius chitinivorans TaxID=1679083 RepID=UPI0014045809|nr:hypothetical protein [Natrarchaeobius chitinivorans]
MRRRSRTDAVPIGDHVRSIGPRIDRTDVSRTEIEPRELPDAKTAVGQNDGRSGEDGARSAIGPDDQSLWIRGASM